MNIQIAKKHMLAFQKAIIQMAEKVDGQSFSPHEWQRPSGGGGKTCVLTNGGVFEQAGVNFSEVFGTTLPKSATASRPELTGRRFHATGVSVVMHPKNPFVPTSHFNVRLFCATQQDKKPIWWIGGGFDLTPYFGFEQDCVFWHTCAKAACDSAHPHFYPRFKHWCDEYFFIKHRKEARGIGGIFFDDLTELSFDNAMGFLAATTQAYIKGYQHIVDKRKKIKFGERERKFQLYRRGRYVEFNLIYDRGTLFGLQSGGRTESILMSMPPAVNWRYDWQPEPHSKEAELYEKFLPVRDWV